MNDSGYPVDNNYVTCDFLKYVRLFKMGVTFEDMCDYFKPYITSQILNLQNS